ncbi:MAG: 2-C-methyl-D-erythritol 2,4-cyclodiphosphate synthase [Candidatus Cloacimonadaceae bacterium]|jgi:2-C-methyl-D-erythritol 2,4-cyclodiphosphate synthase
MLRIGHGYDVHKLVPDRPLILGGVRIEHEYGLLGHSDADVLLHAVMDALLGALALGDIGAHFPPSDPKYKDADSGKLLKAVWQMVTDKGYQLVNLDATIVCEQPKLKPYIDAMRTSLASLLAADEQQISIKATTEEGLGVSGSGGITAHCVLLLSAKSGWAKKELDQNGLQI